MNAGTSVIAGVAVVISGLGTLTACAGPVQGGSTDYTEATPISTSAATVPSAAVAGAAATAPTSATTAITATTQHAGPSDATGALATAAPAAATPPPAAASTPAAAPAAAPTAAKAPVTPAAPASTTGATMAGTTGATPPPSSGWNAGSGTALPDGKTVEYHIPDGTGGTDWNKKDNPIRVKRGMTLHLIDDDKSTRAGGHWLHTNGQPCLHGLMAIGQGFDCAISMSAPMGVVPGVFEHNVANGIGQLYIEVVAEAN